MVERRICTFCGTEIEPGTGRMYIKKDGVVYNFCTSKCYKNLVVLGRVPRRTTWTRYYEREKGVRMKGVPAEEEAPKAKKIPKAAAKLEEAASKEVPKEAPKETPKEKPKEEPAGKPKPEPKAEEKKPEHKEAPKKPAPQRKSEPAKKEKPKAAEKPKRSEGAEE